MLGKKARVLLFLVILIATQVVCLFGYGYIVPGNDFLFTGYEEHLKTDFFTTAMLLMLSNFSIGFCGSAIVVNLGPKHPYTRNLLRILSITIALGTMFYFILTIPDLNTQKKIYNFTEVIWSFSNLAIGISAGTIKLKYSNVDSVDEEW